MIHTLNLENPVVKSFLFYASVLIGKTMFMSPLTARWRFKKGVSIILIRCCNVTYYLREE